MRIRRLDLIRIGPFSNRTLTFDQGEFGFHLIYGPNEGGKSSSLRALKQWLFGIKGEKTCRDHFLHTHNELRVGGVIEDDNGNTLECIRRKGGQKSLRAGDDKAPVDLAELQTFLHHVNEEQFSHQFGIDLEQLVTGGRAIVAGGGDVGESLFSAGAGAANLSKVSKLLESRCESLFKTSGTRSSVNAAIIELNAARAAVVKSSVPSRQWQEQTQSLEDTIAKRKTLDDAIIDLESRRDRLHRISQALPMIGSLKDKRSELVAGADAPRLGEDFGKRRTDTVSALSVSRAALTTAETELKSVTSRIDELDVPKALLDHESAIGDLYQNLERYREWMRTCPELKSNRKTLEKKANRALTELGKTPESKDSGDLGDQVRISAVDRVRIHELADQRSGLTQAVNDAKQNLETKTKTLGHANEELAELATAVDTRPLRRAIEEAQKLGDLDQQVAAKQDRLDEITRRSAVELQRLTLWKGTLDELESLPLPSVDSISRYAAEFASHDQTIAKIESEIHGLEDQIAAADTKLSAIESTQDVPTEEELNVVRSERDAAWKEIRTSLASAKANRDEGVTDAFETLVRRCDEIGDRLRREAERVAEKSRWIADREGWRRSLETRTSRLEAARTEREIVQQDWTQQWLLAGIEPRSPLEMKDWLAGHAKLVELASEIRKQQADCERDRETMLQHRLALQARLTEVAANAKDANAKDANAKDADAKDAVVFNDSTPLATVVDHCQDACKSLEAANARREQLSVRIAQLREEWAAASTRLDEAERHQSTWQQQWKSAVGVLDGNADLTTTQAKAMLDLIEQVVQDIDAAAELSRQWTHQHNQIESFDESVTSLVGRLDIELEKSSVELTVADLHDRLGKAREQKAMRDGLAIQRDRLLKQRSTATQAIDEHTAKLNDLRLEAECESVDQIADVERRSKQRAQLEQEIDSLESQLRRWSHGAELESFIETAQAEDPDRLAPMIAQLESEVQQAKAERDRLSESIGGQQKDLDRTDGGDDAAVASEKVEIAMTGLRAAADSYVRVKLASVILKRAVQRYRQQNQGPVLERASQIFSDLTLGAFSGLRSEYVDDDQPALVGVRAPGGTLVGVDGMSEGTCDQLFLALRIASLENHFASHPPMPFVVDDILVKFDDARSAAAMRVLAELSRKTQVIMFTHHQHLVEVARQAVPPAMLFVQSLDDEDAIEATAVPEPATAKSATKKPATKKTRAPKVRKKQSTDSAVVRETSGELF